MTSPRRPQATADDFAKTRLDAAAAENVQRHRATRIVTSHALDAADRDDLLAMLGLDPTRQSPTGPPRSRLDRLV
jgi:hypothetical protein